MLTASPYHNSQGHELNVKMSITKCSSKYRNKIWNGIYCQCFIKYNCFQFQVSEGTWPPKLLCTIEWIAITSHYNLLSFAQRVIFRIAGFDPWWRSGEENNTQYNSLKLHRWQKQGFYSWQNLWFFFLFFLYGWIIIEFWM